MMFPTEKEKDNFNKAFKNLYDEIYKALHIEAVAKFILKIVVRNEHSRNKTKPYKPR